MTNLTPTLELTLECPQSPVGPSPTKSEDNQFTLLPKNNTVEKITFDGSKEIIFGRDNMSCTNCFDDPALSRIHCKLSSIGREVWCHDMSTNGVHVNGKKLGKGNKKLLHAGDEIVLGDNHKDPNLLLAWTFVCANEEASSSTNKPGEEIFKYYSITRDLGSGNFAVVKMGTCLKTGEKVAVKIIDKKKFALQDDFNMSTLLTEVEILRNVSHKNVISIHNVFDSPTALYIVLELINGGDLFDYIAGRVGRMGNGGSHPFTESEAKVLFVQLMEALLYLHHKGIAHRDLKPENILLHVAEHVPRPSKDAQMNAPKINVTDVVLKITDFGLAKYCGDHAVMTTMCGTPTYLAPEVLHPTAKGGGYSKLVDVWSIGVMLYIMLSGVPPKDPHSGKVEFHAKYFSHTTEVVRDLITRMLQVNPLNRFGLKEILNHEWLKGVDIVGRELAEPNMAFVAPVAREPTTLAFVVSDPSKVDSDEDTRTEAPKHPSSTTEVAAVQPSSTPTDPIPISKSQSDSNNSNVPKKRERDGTDPATPTWLWKNNVEASDDDPTAWVKYNKEESQRLEQGFQRKFKTCKINDSYRASLVDMFQFRVDDNSKQRTIKRVI